VVFGDRSFMDEVIYYYHRLLQLLEEEESVLSLSLQGELHNQYLRVIRKEKDDVERNLRIIYNN
jgi:hypothetical protein